MRVLVTGSAGHLGEGLDLLQSPSTSHVGSVTDRGFVRKCLHGIDVVIHSATLHKPYVATHSRRAFVETNVAGTLAVLEAALENRVSGVVFSSTTSVPRNIYGVTKKAGEDLCELFFRFFPEEDDDAELRRQYDALNLKANEYLYRRLGPADVVDAHILAAERAEEIGFSRYVVSATSPFERRHRSRLRTDAQGVVRSLFPDYEETSRREFRGRALSCGEGLIAES